MTTKHNNVKQQPIPLFTVKFGIVAICCFTLLFTSCKKQSAANNKPLDYFKIMRVTDSLRNIKNDTTSIHYIDSIFGSRTRLTIKERYQQYDLKRSYYYEGPHNYLMANLYADSMLMVLKGKEQDKEYYKDYGNAYQVKGDALLALKRYNEAFLYYYRGKAMVAKISDGNYNSGYSARLGLNCYKQGKFKEAVNYFKQAYHSRLPYRPKNKDELYQQLAIEQELLDDVGLSYSKLNMADSALIYYKKTLSAINSLGQRFKTPKDSSFTQTATGVVLGNMGDVYYKAGDIKTATTVWQRSIAINTQKGHDNHDARLTQIKLANLYITNNELPAARRILDELQASMNDEQDEGTKLKWYKVEWDYHEKAGMVQQAYKYVKSYLSLKDSIALVDRDNAVDMGVAFTVFEQQHANELLKKSNALKQLYLFTAILIAAVGFLIAFLIGQNWKRSKRNVTLLTRLNREISNHNEQMQQTLTALEQSQEDNTQMMKIVAHDLRNPVGNMTTIASLLLEQPGLSSEQRELLDILQTSGLNSLELISTLLQANSSQENLTKEPVDLFVLLNYCVAVMKFKAKEKHQEIILHSAHITLLLNREKMWRVISNLIANAIKFSPEHSMITISTEEKPKAVLISVDDNGIGIPADIKEKIFDMLTTAKRKGTAGEEPFGMGLSIARQIAEAHEGKIWLESKPNGGTIFYVELPKKEA